MAGTNVSEEYDVVVVGYGVSGLSAGIAARERGAETLLLEKSPREVRGGHTRHAGGLFRFPMEELERVADELGLETVVERHAREDFYDDPMDVSGGRADSDLCRILVENACDAVAWLGEHGVEWQVVDHSEEPGWGTTVGNVQAVGEGEG